MYVDGPRIRETEAAEDQFRQGSVNSVAGTGRDEQHHVVVWFRLSGERPKRCDDPLNELRGRRSKCRHEWRQGKTHPPGAAGAVSNPLSTADSHG
jgi:hypothetical protein